MLTPAEVQAFEERGFFGPFPMYGPEEMAAVRERLEAVLAAGEDGWKARHLNCRAVWDVCSHPALVERVASLLGPDLVLWSTRFRVKYPGTREIPWHQDAAYWQLEPMVNVSAWLAIDNVDRENSCVQLIPGSHRDTVPHVALPADAHYDFPLRAEPAYCREQEAVSMVMRAGECFLFTERTLHRSSANQSSRRRAALTIRITATSVKVRHPEAGQVLLLRGRDTYGHNPIAAPP
jgi:ectoine hydroxylase-related dioxygenase (phytanoyl-CoA dioxygenase family)